METDIPESDSPLPNPPSPTGWHCTQRRPPPLQGDPYDLCARSRHTPTSVWHPLLRRGLLSVEADLVQHVMTLYLADGPAPMDEDVVRCAQALDPGVTLVHVVPEHGEGCSLRWDRWLRSPCWARLVDRWGG